MTYSLHFYLPFVFLRKNNMILTRAKQFSFFLCLFSISSYSINKKLSQIKNHSRIFFSLLIVTKDFENLIHKLEKTLDIFNYNLKDRELGLKVIRCTYLMFASLLLVSSDLLINISSSLYNLIYVLHFTVPSLVCKILIHMCI